MFVAPRKPTGSVVEVAQLAQGAVVPWPLCSPGTEDDVVENLDLEQLTSADEVTRNPDVRLTRGRIAAGVVVNENDR